MKRLELTNDSEVILKTTLSKGQVAKFNILVDRLKTKNGVAYIPTGELHGALLTRSKKSAQKIVQAYRDVIRIYLVSAEEIGLQTSDAYILPIGLQILLHHLAQDNPKRASDYRASVALIAYIIAGHAQLAFESSIEAREVISNEQVVIARLKRQHTSCQLSGQPFNKDNQQHAHHVSPKSIEPALCAEESNIVIITGKLHLEYHSWVESLGGEVSRSTLRNFCRKHQYSLDWDTQSSFVNKSA
ncbi:MAG: hypothetical protein AAGF01_17485 [Cyanobacteria bacterium P01_G01_bin.38]